jgi:hypothetical protein
MAHVVGFGLSPDWNTLVSAGRFTGGSAVSLFGDSIPLASGNTHWAGAPGSQVFGSDNTQVALMTTGISTGIRRRLTALDAAALADIGWTVLQPGMPGDYNDDGFVNAADYTVWRNALGQTSDLSADGNYDGQIDWNDYEVWKTGYGAASGLGSSFATHPSEVPEPGAATILVVSAALLLWRRRAAVHTVSIPTCGRTE